MQYGSPDQQIGDKVRVKIGDHKGKRGLITVVTTEFVEVILDDEIVINISRDRITNYSLAARRAWQVMPKKAGRPKDETPKTKMVSLRLDIELWDKLGRAVTAGIIPNKEFAMNALLEEYINKIFKDNSL